MELEAKKCQEITLKCLRGIVAFPASIIWRDVVTNHFLPEIAPDGNVHSTGQLYQSSALIQSPQNQDEVREIVQTAIQQGKKVSISGAGYSQGKQILPVNSGDFHINMSGLNQVKIDVRNKRARVGAGITWCQIQQEADQYGLAAQAMQASNVFSVGGSLSANCHGWDHIIGTLANTVIKNWRDFVPNLQAKE